MDAMKLPVADGCQQTAFLLLDQSVGFCLSLTRSQSLHYSSTTSSDIDGEEHLVKRYAAGVRDFGSLHDNTNKNHQLPPAKRIFVPAIEGQGTEEQQQQWLPSAYKETMEGLKLPVIDLSLPDCLLIAKSISQACIYYGSFYLVNHGVEEELLSQMFNESRKFFSLPLEDKMRLARKELRGYTALYAENLDPTSSSKGDSKESFEIGPLEGTLNNLNKWPSGEILPSWRSTMEYYYETVLSAGRRLIHLIALALNLDENFFEEVGALDVPTAFLCLLHYPREFDSSNEETCGTSAHSDYGMITLLATDGVPGLQVCREKFKQPRVWEDVPNIKGAFIVNIGDMMERWTNCLFRSTLHGMMPAGQERYSAAFFLDPNSDCVVERMESCFSESCPPRFAPIRNGDYFKERFSLTCGS